VVANPLGAVGEAESSKGTVRLQQGGANASMKVRCTGDAARCPCGLSLGFSICDATKLTFVATRGTKQEADHDRRQ